MEVHGYTEQSWNEDVANNGEHFHKLIKRERLSILININSYTHLNRYLTISKLKRLVL
jgi:hypothetical protein